MIELSVKMFPSGTLNVKSINVGKKGSSGIYKLKLITDKELEGLEKFIVIKNKAYNISNGVVINEVFTKQNMEVYFMLKGYNTQLKSDILKLEVK